MVISSLLLVVLPEHSYIDPGTLSTALAAKGTSLN